MTPMAEAAAEWTIYFYENITEDDNQAPDDRYDYYGTEDSLSLYEVMPNYTRNGYAMTSFNTESDGSGVEYEFDAEFGRTLPAGVDDITLYTQWEQVEDYYILYCGETTEDGKAYLLETGLDGEITLADGDVFDYDDDKVVVWRDRLNWEYYLAGETISINDNMILQAAERGTKAIRLYYQNEDHEWEDSIKVYRSEYSIIGSSYTSFADDLYFVGWNTEPDGTGTSFASDECAINAPDELYAQYILVPQDGYCVLIPNDSNESNFQFAKLENGKITLPDEVNGCKIAYWQEADRKYYPCGIEIAVKSGTELVGQPLDALGENRYFYIIDGNGGTTSTNSQYVAGYSNITFLRVNEFEKESAVLIGFKGKKTGTLYSFSDRIQDACKAEADENRIAEFTAEYENIDGDYIAYMGNGLQTAEGKDYYIQTGLDFDTSLPTAIQNPFELPDGKHFWGWSSTSSGYNNEWFSPGEEVRPSDNVLYAMSGRYCIVFHWTDEYGEDREVREIDSSYLFDPFGENENYIFSGWNTNSDGSGQWYVDGDKITVDSENGILHLYAQREMLPTSGYYYVLRDGKFDDGKCVKIVRMQNQTETIILPTEYGKDSILVAWSEDPYFDIRREEDNQNILIDNPKIHPIGSTMTIASGTYLYALQHDHILVQFNGNGVTDSDGKETKIYSTTTSWGDMELYSADKVFGTTPADKEFDSWNTAADGSGTSYKAGDSVSPGLYELFAQWINKAVDIVKPSEPATSTTSGSDTKKSISVSDSDHGDVSISPKKATKGKTVTITVEPDKGYEVDEVYVTDKNGKSVKVKDKGNGKYTFTMPDSKVEIEVTYTAVDETPTVIAAAPIVFAANYVDVSPNDWFASAVQYVSSAGLMQGSNGSFAPEDSMTRGMMAQILYNRDGNGVHFGATFPDVSLQAWYADAAAWSAANQIFIGYDNGMFGADDPITREQLAVILYNYARAKGYNISAVGELAVFTDGASVSGYAQTAMSWATGMGLMRGNNAYLNPKTPATRAEVAVILQQFFTFIMQ